jgi:hypothetical protein
VLVIVGQAGEPAKLGPLDELRLDATPPSHRHKIGVIRGFAAEDQAPGVPGANQEDRPDGVLPVYKFYARDRYLPSRVSTRIVSPSEMNSGT